MPMQTPRALQSLSGAIGVPSSRASAPNSGKGAMLSEAQRQAAQPPQQMPLNQIGDMRFMQPDQASMQAQMDDFARRRADPAAMQMQMQAMQGQGRMQAPQGIAALMEALQRRQPTGQSMPFMQPGPTADQRMDAPMAPQPPAQGGFSGKGSSMPQNPMTQNRPFDPRLAMMLRQR